MFTNLNGIILAGGKSRRMGSNKSLLKVGDKTIIERLIDQLKDIFNEVILVTNSPNDYKFTDIRKYKDLYPYMGPLAGIHSGLIHSNTTINLILTCDMPLMSKEMIEHIVQYKTDKSITICRDKNFIHPFPGLYSKSIIRAIETILNNASRKQNGGKHKYSVSSLFNNVEPEIVETEDLEIYNDNLFKNMNTMDDYYRILNILKL